MHTLLIADRCPFHILTNKLTASFFYFILCRRVTTCTINSWSSDEEKISSCIMGHVGCVFGAWRHWTSCDSVYFSFTVSSSIKLLNTLLLIFILFIPPSLCGPIREPQYANVAVRMSYFFINSWVWWRGGVYSKQNQSSDVGLSSVCFFDLWVCENYWSTRRILSWGSPSKYYDNKMNISASCDSGVQSSTDL